jgi:hypothetical protein
MYAAKSLASRSSRQSESGESFGGFGYRNVEVELVVALKEMVSEFVGDGEPLTAGALRSVVSDHVAHRPVRSGHLKRLPTKVSARTRTPQRFASIFTSIGRRTALGCIAAHGEQLLRST